MCCVLWDLCVCFSCQDGIYISDMNKRFLKSTVTLCTKCRSKFYLPSLRQSTSVPYSPLAAGGTAQCEVGWWPCTVLLFRLCACHGLTSVKYPWALGRVDVHPETTMWALDPIFGPLCHREKYNVILVCVSNSQKGPPALGGNCEVWPVTGFLAVSRKGVSWGGVISTGGLLQGRLVPRTSPPLLIQGLLGR